MLEPIFEFLFTPLPDLLRIGITLFITIMSFFKMVKNFSKNAELKKFGIFAPIFFLLLVISSGFLSILVAILVFIAFWFPFTILVVVFAMFANHVWNKRGIAKYGEQRWNEMKEEWSKEDNSNDIDFD